MIVLFKVLKIVVTLLVMVLSLGFHIGRIMLGIGKDAAARTKAETPQMIAALKAHAQIEAAKAPGIAEKINTDLRAKLKLVETKKTAA